MPSVNPADIIEAVLFASDRPVPFKKLAQILDLAPDAAQEELDILREEKSRIGALQLVEVAGGWQLMTKPAFSAHIGALRAVPRQKLSRAAFEVLAIVAYRQPATRSEIEALRGVDCSAPVQYLLEKKLIAFAGRKEVPGRPYLFATTEQFLDNFGLRCIEDLPSLAELTELNEGTVLHDGDSLFNRGTMRPFEDVQAEPQPGGETEGAHGEVAAASEAVATDATATAAAPAPERETTDAEPVADTDEDTATTEDASREAATAESVTTESASAEDASTEDAVDDAAADTLADDSTAAELQTVEARA